MAEERKKVWINVFQTKLFIRIAVYWVIYMITLMNLLFVWRLVIEGPGNPVEQYLRFLVDFAPALVLVALLLPAVAWDAVKFSIGWWGRWYAFARRCRTWPRGNRCSRSSCARGIT